MVSIDQLPGCVIADIRIGGDTEFKLLHPDTGPSNGHVDVYVNYAGAAEPIFSIYSQFQRFVPSDNYSRMLQVFPAGAWSLVMVVIAIEKYLEKRFGFTPRLQKQLLSGLK